MSTTRTIRRDSGFVSPQRPMLAVVSTALAFVYVALSWFDEKLDKRRSRRLLQEMSDHQLKDIGISRADAFEEARRPFWD